MSRVPLAGRRIWLTGASSGIGRACALEFVRRGARVAISARNTSALESLASEIRAMAPGSGAEEPVLVLPLDVRDRQANHDTVAEIVRSWGGIDTIFLNAGIAELVDSDTFDASVFDRVFATNFHSVTYGMEAGLPVLRKGNRPHLVGMSSASAFFPLPLAEAYGAAKSGVRYLLDTFRIRAEAQGLQVTGVYLGFVRTSMVMDQGYPTPLSVSPGQAARAIADGIERRRREIIHPKAFVWTIAALGALPRWIYQPIAARFVRFFPVFSPGGTRTRDT